MLIRPLTKTALKNDWFAKNEMALLDAATLAINGALDSMFKERRSNPPTQESPLKVGERHFHGNQTAKSAWGYIVSKKEFRQKVIGVFTDSQPIELDPWQVYFSETEQQICFY